MSARQAIQTRHNIDELTIRTGRGPLLDDPKLIHKDRDVLLTKLKEIDGVLTDDLLSAGGLAYSIGVRIKAILDSA